jgi:hypothetical protein
MENGFNTTPSIASVQNATHAKSVTESSFCGQLFDCQEQC